MDYYYYDQVADDEELGDNEDYDYDSMLLAAEEHEAFKDVYQGCIKSSNQQVQQYILVLLGCAFLQRIAWELVRRLLGNRQAYLYHSIALLCGLISLWFYVGNSGSFYVCLHVLNLCLSLKLILHWKPLYTGALICVYTILCQLLFEYFLKSEQYETIRGPQMVISMKLISLAFEIQDDKLKYEFLTYLGYLLSPASLILGPWVSLKNYKPDFSVKCQLIPLILRVMVYLLLAVLFLNLSNCIVPWLRQLLRAGLWWGTYLDAFAVRCSHYFVCYLSQATVITASASFSITSSSFVIVNPLAIELPRSLAVAIRNWNIPMHLWLKQNIFNRLRSTKYPYFMALLLTYLVSCLVHGLNYKVHLVLISLSCFSYFENLLRRCLAQVFDACIEATACKQNCKYSNCPRKGGYFSSSLLLVRLVNFSFSLIVIIQLSYLGIMLNATSSTNSNTRSKTTESLLHSWTNMNYLGHLMALTMFVFYKCI
ncbi:protein-serine O-palmitoleoyltransferase por [Cochliomyia hominivorax]